MLRNMVKALIFLVLFLAASSYIGIREEQQTAVTAEKAQKAQKAEQIEQVEVIKEQKPEIILSGMELQPGGCFAIYLSGMTDRDEVKVSTNLSLEQPVFFKQAEGRLAIVGVSCRMKAGEYMYNVQVLRDGKIAAEKAQVLKILPKEFEKQYLTVSITQKEQRSDDNFDSDKVYTDKAKSVTSDKPLWEGTFVKPVEGRISTEFGMIRYINKDESSRHSGLDLAAAKGTPVKAANNGIVRLSMLLKVTGNTVIIDHGCNVYSSYAHLDKLLVAEGDEVKKGDIIGEVGSTGFSTGPHLHWTTTIGKVYINPETLVEKDPLEFSSSIDK
ncbi:MAG TPA: M23 family metallopeptidase [Negativicutes bacterium]|nr:M23 family metallopeptidase [Negativicutes bacterium]